MPLTTSRASERPVTDPRKPLIGLAAAFGEDTRGAFVVARGWAVVARPLRATLGLSLGAPIHTVRAVANETTIASVSGVLLGATLGLGGAW